MRNLTTTILTLTLLAATPAIAQETTTTNTATTATADATTEATTTATDTAAPEATTTTRVEGDAGEGTSYQLRSQFAELLQRHPDELSTVLAYEPTLLSNQQFLNEHPELARFVAAHPVVATNARFYVEQFGRERQPSVVNQIVEPLVMLSVFSIIAFALTWLVRTIIEQKRWNKLSRTQSEVHNKILDRFGTTGELLDYVKSPAGAKFLESAPIPLHAESAPQSTPVTRVIWSIQIGVIVAAAAIGMLLVSLRFEAEAGRELFAMGVIALCIGLGFVASAAVSIFLTRRLGGMQPGDATSEIVR